MRYLSPEYVRSAYPHAASALAHPDGVVRIVYFDGYLYLMDEQRHGYSEAYWMPSNKLWAPHVRKIA